MIDAALKAMSSAPAVCSHDGNEVFGLILLTERQRGIFYKKPVSEDMARSDRLSAPHGRAADRAAE